MLLVACTNPDNKNEAGTNTEPPEILKETGMPIVDEEITLNFFAGKAPATADNWNDVMLFNKYKEMTNINIKWDQVPHASLPEKRNLALASGNLPDAFHSASIPTADILKYGEQGTFIPLNDLIDKYAPNLKKILDENPDVKQALTFPDGNIYSFPQMAEPEFTSYRMGPKPRINEEWLEVLGIDMPETTEDFYQYLKAVKEGDPNGNGQADEIPFGAPSIGMLVNYLQGSFGLANKGNSNRNVDLDPETGELRFFQKTDEYKELLQYVNKLYSEGLIEQSIFTSTMEQYHANGSETKYGSTVWYSPVEIFGDSAIVYTGMPVLEGPNGHKQFNSLMPPVLNPGAFVITNANKHPEATVRWIDYFYGDDGMKMFFMGFEGETYEKNEDGELVYMDHIMNSADGLTYEQELAKYLTFPGGGFPTITTRKYFKGTENSPQDLEAAERLAPDLVESPWAPFKYTNEETKTLAGVGADVEKYVTEMTDKFIAGDVPFSKWDEYLKTLENIGLEKYMDIKRAAYERYENDK
nr:extracellular solute-binding protein [Sporosarcina sp. 6E9]